MPLPTRPVDAADIETEWGQQVHDYTFAPKGCEVSGGSRTVSNVTGGLRISFDTAVNDPGGFHDVVAGNLTVPTGGEGLYIMFLVVDSVNGTTGDETRAFLYINGVARAHSLEDNAGGTHIRITVSVLAQLTAGDIITAYAQKKGTGTNPTVYVESLRIARIGADYGA